MHEDDRTGYDDPHVSPWAHHARAASALQRLEGGNRSRRLRRNALLATAVLGLAVAFWPRSSIATLPAGAAPRWNVELSSTGRHPVTALVFGKEAGVHLVSVPGTDATADERRRIPARLGNGDVYMVSLGWSPLEVHATSPRGTAPMSFAAQARFVRLFAEQRGTGISTSWR